MPPRSPTPYSCPFWTRKSMPISFLVVLQPVDPGRTPDPVGRGGTEADELALVGEADDVATARLLCGALAGLDRAGAGAGADRAGRLGSSGKRQGRGRQRVIAAMVTPTMTRRRAELFLEITLIRLSLVAPVHPSRTGCRTSAAGGVSPSSSAPPAPRMCQRTDSIGSRSPSRPFTSAFDSRSAVSSSSVRARR